MRVLGPLVLLVVCGSAAPVSAQEWRWPLEGPPRVSRPFDAPASRYAAGHRGADLPSVPGAAVRAAGDGWVSYAGLVAGRGVVVVVHGELRTTYEPVGALVDVGSGVVAGEVIGLLDAGHLGCSALACLHWGLRRGDDHLDPVRLVRPGPVRLLPLHSPPPVAAVPERGGRRAVTGTAAEGAAPASTDVEDPGLRAPAAPTAAVSRPVGGGLAAGAGALLLGAAAAGATWRRRR